VLGTCYQIQPASNLARKGALIKGGSQFERFRLNSKTQRSLNSATQKSVSSVGAHGESVSALLLAFNEFGWHSVRRN
jgi:hypothetical protein